jgi:ribosomal protein S26
MKKHDHEFAPVVPHTQDASDMTTCDHCGSSVPKKKPVTTLQCRICGKEKS